MTAIVLGLAVVFITTTIFVDANCRQFAPDDCLCWRDRKEMLDAKENCPEYVDPTLCDMNLKYRCRWFGEGAAEAIGCNSEEPGLFQWRAPSALITREQTPREWRDPFAALWERWENAYKNEDEDELIKIFIQQYDRIEVTEEEALSLDRIYENNVYPALRKVELLALKTYTDYSAECSKFRSAFRLSCDYQKIPANKWQCISYHQIWNEALKHAFEHLHQSYTHSLHQKQLLEQRLYATTKQQPPNEIQQQQIRDRIEELNRIFAVKYLQPRIVYHGENSICDDLFVNFLLKPTVKLLGPFSTSIMEGVAHRFASQPTGKFGIIFDLIPVYEQHGNPTEYTPPIDVQYLSNHAAEKEILFYDGTFSVIGYRTIQHRATDVINKEFAETCMAIIEDNLNDDEEWTEMDDARKEELKKWCYVKRYGYEECWEKVGGKYDEFEPITLLDDRHGIEGYNQVAKIRAMQTKTIKKCHRLFGKRRARLFGKRWIYIDNIRAQFSEEKDVRLCIKYLSKLKYIHIEPIQKAEIEYYNNIDYVTELSDNSGSKSQSLSSISYYPSSSSYEQLLYLGLTILFVLLLCTLYLLVCIVCWIFGYYIAIKK